jgi:hypothetical protein
MRPYGERGNQKDEDHLTYIKNDSANEKEGRS